MAFDYQLLATARIADFERIAVKADLLRQARRAMCPSLPSDGPYPVTGSSTPQTRAA